jgi:hypothetical protein
LISSAAEALESPSAGHDSDRVVAEASLTAMWAILRGLVEERRFGDLSELAPFMDELL